MTRVVIRNISQLRTLAQKLRSAAKIIPILQTNALDRAADDVLSNIHRDMETNKFSKKIIDSTYVGPINLLNNKNSVEIHFISDYVSDDGFDVSKGREEGTRDHDVFPLKPDGWLTYIDENTGKRVFRKHTHPSGIKRLLIIETNIHKSQQSFKDNYEKEIISTLKPMVII